MSRPRLQALSLERTLRVSWSVVQPATMRFLAAVASKG